ncbi:TniQ family protein [Microvirga soli]|uniref:TniQ family protein n=1 Tax=Microvirga soli TaxID=1854496 RepID=UPI00191F3048|nr:TniQ family protein [Microvirga soli]
MTALARGITGPGHSRAPSASGAVLPDVPANPSAGRLVVRSPPLPQEGFLEWLLRLSARNVLPGPHAILKAAGLGGGLRDHDRDKVVARVAALTGAPPEAVSVRLAGRRGGPREGLFIIPGHPDLRRRMLRFHRPAVCLACLEENGGVVPAAWSLIAWVACPRHGCRMVRTCTACSTPLSWSRPAAGRCGAPGCGRTLSRDAPDPAPLPVVDLVRLIAKAAGVPDVPPSSLEPVFGSLPLKHLLMTISALDAPLPDTPDKKIWTSRRTGEDAAHAAAELLWDWPRRFHAHLHRIRDPDAAGRHVSLQKEFPEFFRRVSLSSFLPDDARKILLHEAMAFLDEHWTGDPAKSQRLSRRVGSLSTSKWISRGQAARRLRVNSPAIVDLVSKGRLKGESRVAGASTRLCIDRADLERFVVEENRHVGRAAFKATNGLLTKQQVARRLGVDLPQVVRLAESGHLEQRDRYPDVYYTGASADRLVAMFECAAASAMPDPGQSASRRRVVSERGLRQGRLSIDIVKLVEAVASGLAAPAQVDQAKSGLRRYSFDADEMKALARTLSGDTTLDVVAAQKALGGCGTKDVPRLIAAGLLADLRSGGGTCGGQGVRRRVTRESVESLRREVAPSSVLAREHGVAANGFDQLMTRLGLKPVLPRAGENTRSFWRRAEVAAALAGREARNASQELRESAGGFAGIGGRNSHPCVERKS